MYIADMHCDSLTAVNSSRGLINGYNLSAKYPQLQFFAAFVPVDNDPPEYRRRKIMHLLNVYIAERERLGLVSVESAKDISIAERTGRRASIFSIEGGGGLFADSEELDLLYRLGLRVLGLCWDTNELAASAFDKFDTGLTKDGIEMAMRCSEMGIILDVSHLSDRSFYQLLDVTGYPLIATHSNFREICDNPRNLTLDMAKRIVGRGGVIGLNLYPDFIKAGGNPTAEDILKQVDFALENLGDDALGFGFDIDGTGGAYPEGFSERESLHDRLIDIMLSRYSSSTVEKIAGRNVLTFLENNI